MSWPAYPEYKDSGFEWIGAIPKHWQIKKLRYLVRCLDANRVPLNAEQRHHRKGNVPYWGANSIMDYLDEALFDEELVLLGEDGAPFFEDNRPVAFYSSGPVWPNNHIHVLRPLNPNWSRHIVHNLNVTEYIDFVEGSTRHKLTQSRMMDIPIAWPSHGERERILDFLDHETARIDALIEEQQRLIDLLQEKRQAVISHAVSKGLDPDVPMKDGGVELLGEIPEHWSLKRLKHIAPFITVGIVVNPSSYVAETGLPFIYGGEVREGTIDVDRARTISAEDSIKNQKTMLEAGDLVTVRVGYPGLTAVVPEQCEGGNCASVMLTKRGNYDSSWLCNVMNSRIVRHQIDLVQYGAAQKQFNISDAVEFLIFTPPLDEQKEISAFVERECSKLDYLANTAEEMKGFLQEHRSALISAAVTGKIDVRDWKPQDAPVEHDLPMAAEAEAQYG